MYTREFCIKRRPTLRFGRFRLGRFVVFFIVGLTVVVVVVVVNGLYLGFMGANRYSGLSPYMEVIASISSSDKS